MENVEMVTCSGLIEDGKEGLTKHFHECKGKQSFHLLPFKSVLVCKPKLYVVTVALTYGKKTLAVEDSFEWFSGRGGILEIR